MVSISDHHIEWVSIWWSRGLLVPFFSGFFDPDSPKLISIGPPSDFVEKFIRLTCQMFKTKRTKRRIYEDKHEIASQVRLLTSQARRKKDTSWRADEDPHGKVLDL